MSLKTKSLNLKTRNIPSAFVRSVTVYLIITAMLGNFYNYLVRKVSEVFTDILPKSRLKRFIFRFITVAGRYIYQGRRWILQLYTNRNNWVRLKLKFCTDSKNKTPYSTLLITVL